MRFSLDEDEKKLSYVEAVELLKGNQAQREMAIAALAEMRGRKAVSRLLNVIETEDYVTRLKAVDALAAIGRDAVAPLVKALEEGLWHVRECAAMALGKIGDPRTVKPILERLRDENIGVRQAAEGALKSFLDANLQTVAKALQDLHHGEVEQLLQLVAQVDLGKAAELRERLVALETEAPSPDEEEEIAHDAEDEVTALQGFRKTMQNLSATEDH